MSPKKCYSDSTFNSLGGSIYEDFENDNRLVVLYNGSPSTRSATKLYHISKFTDNKNKPWYNIVEFFRYHKHLFLYFVHFTTWNYFQNYGGKKIDTSRGNEKNTCVDILKDHIRISF